MPEQAKDAKTQAEVVAEPKPKKTYPKRDRKAYMQQYYLKHRIPTRCSGCDKEFASERILKHHEENNKYCLIRRLEGLFGSFQNNSQEEGSVEPVVQNELRRMRKIIARGEVSSI